MLILKTNIELKKVFTRLIKTVNAPVTWTDHFVIANNNLILLGTGRSLIFSFDNKKVYTNLMDISTEKKRIERIPNQALINNILNMTLYAFGKWGAIGGLKVEKDYAALNELFSNIFGPLRIEAQLRNEGMRFYKNGMQVTFEDAVAAAMKMLKEEGKGETEEENGQTGPDGEAEREDGSLQADDGEETERQSGYEEDDEYEIGLWHKMVWKKEVCTFEKNPQSEKDAVKSRIGNNFYMTEYQCPKCREKLYMGVYPEDREILIETDEARVFMARTYACNTCNIFYTPRPEKLLQEGDVYSLKFDVDRVAFEDYLEVLGNKAERTTNYKFNEYESDRLHGKRKDGEEESGADTGPRAEENEAAGEGDASGKKKGKAGIFTRGKFGKGGRHFGTAFGGRNRTNASSQIEEGAPGEAGAGTETKGRIKAKEGSAIKDRTGAENQPDTESRTGTGEGAETKGWMKPEGQPEPDERQGRYIGPNGRLSGREHETGTLQNTGAAGGREQGEGKKELSAEMKKNKARLMEKTTEELKVILTGLENKAESVMAERGKDRLAGREYIELVQETLKEKLTAKYDARVETLGNFSLRQLTELKKQIGQESCLSGEEKERYRKKVDRRLYQLEEKSVEQKLELSKNKSYAQIGQLIEEIEKGVESEELKRETIKKLKRIKADRAEREADHLIVHMPLHLDRKQLAAYLEQLDRYKEVDLSPYRKRIEQRKDMAEKEEISAIVKRGGKKDRNALWELYGELEKEDFKVENKAPFLEKIFEKIRKMDEDEIERICPDIASLSFAEGLEAYEKIEQGMFLPELKTNTLEMIERRLTKLKTDEGVQLMRKLKHDMEEKMPGFVHFYFYDAREERKRGEREENGRTGESDGSGTEEKEHAAMMRAVSGYAAARSQYEYPIVVCDTSRALNGKEGFVLTPDHIFYRAFLNAGIMDIMDIEKVEANKGFLSKGIFLHSFSGKKEKLPNSVRTEDWEVFAEILNDFAAYLQEKPESRNLNYLAKEKHDVKCCYRCGFVYKEGNICPKCGSKMNK